MPGLNVNRVTLNGIEAKVVGESYTLLPNGRTTVCQLTLQNGFTATGLTDEEILNCFLATPMPGGYRAYLLAAGRAIESKARAPEGVEAQRFTPENHCVCGAYGGPESHSRWCKHANGVNASDKPVTNQPKES